MSKIFIYKVYNSITGKFLGSVQSNSLNACRYWKKDLAKSLGLPITDVYGRYRTITK